MRKGLLFTLLFSLSFFFVEKDIEAARKTSRYANRQIGKVMKLVNEREYEQASIKLYSLLRSSRMKARDKIRVRYVLGLVFYEMGFYQSAAFQFIKVIRSGDKFYIKKALEHLSLSGDELGDDALLNYALMKIKVRDFPREQKDMLYFRIGEHYMSAGSSAKAISYFSKVRQDYPKFHKAKYLQGLAYTEIGKTRRALRAFDDILSHVGSEDPVNSSRVAALIGKARVYYQRKQWDRALSFYRQVPRDTLLWHDALYESSWAFLRLGKLRSALSNFQSLHSPFYENFYQPESLILRAIVYLYICQYDEIEKVLTLFEKEYKPIQGQMYRYLKQKNYRKSYNEVSSYLTEGVLLGGLGVKIINKIRYETYFIKMHSYITKLLKEREAMLGSSASWRSSRIGIASLRAVNTRIRNAQRTVGRWIHGYVEELAGKLRSYFEQGSIVRFEMISGKKETLKQELLVKGKDATSIDHEKERDFYIQNGFEYWPYQGEAWLDELGNYQYLGVSSCGK